MPVGAGGGTGAPLPPSFRGALSGTFFRKKPGHVLMPGRTQCGEVIVADIGIPVSVLDTIAPDLRENSAPLLPAASAEQHKYQRGHAVVVAATADPPGHGRLAALSALRVD